MRLLGWVSLVLVGIGGGSAFYLSRATGTLPALRGHLVFVSDRSGIDALYSKDLATGDERQLTFLSEPVREPALSPDGKAVAFSMGGRVGLVWPESDRFQILTLGVDWRDTV
ncbi:MAG TPA: hypothetical protein VN083_01285, partial [Vicinamibacteria bacterium]|nr:hypothetical protein [Vicinamibacteria bacterium]